MSDPFVVECEHHIAYCHVAQDGEYFAAWVRFERKADQGAFRIPSLTHKLALRFHDRSDALAAASIYAEERSASGNTELE
ncbi:hypothetical protein GTP38_11235 [Duganella sp. FT94W]|uniref:WGR domain-containing protein n=1 Tax=Duganella lactea TaxID=2692173 RepID=A0ABW9V828_9BURK|nr:hypothetical protein [Duganella lactea]MYM34912.1 hypothetical protein [Duganella lactea]